MPSAHYQTSIRDNSKDLNTIDDSLSRPPWYDVYPQTISGVSILTAAIVVLQSQARPAEGQKQRRAKIATRRPQDRTRLPPHPENRWRRGCETHQDVRPSLLPRAPIPMPSPHPMAQRQLRSLHNPFTSPNPPPSIRYTTAHQNSLTRPLYYRDLSHDLRKSIARVLTYINAQQRSQLRLLYKGKKYLPLDLRPKKTRAIRRRLTKYEATRVSEKQRKRQIHFPMRKYAVKVCWEFLFSYFSFSFFRRLWVFCRFGYGGRSIGMEKQSGCGMSRQREDGRESCHRGRNYIRDPIANIPAGFGLDISFPFLSLLRIFR